MTRARYIQISNGVGSGNVGDELMAQEFWKLLPAGVVLDVPVLPDAARYRGTYPKPHRYVQLADWAIGPDVPGLLVGDTPVAEFEGLGYPLGTVGPSLSAFQSRGLPVDAIAVGVDRLHTVEGRRLFAQHYAAIRSWTVRSSACREALLDLGVAEARIRVAADLAWLFVPNHEKDQWAFDQWNELGIHLAQPLLVVNTVHHGNSTDQSQKRTLASALDRLVRDGGYQVAFLSNETRLGPHFDTGAVADLRMLMEQPSVEVPVAYYSPQEMVSLLRPATAVLTQRYHMAIQAILAETVPVCLQRGQKLSGLAQEFGLLDCSIDSDEIVAQVNRSAARRTDRLRDVKVTREANRRRAKTALSFFREYAVADRRRTRGPAVPPKNPGIVVIHMGGLGDLVLAASLLRALRLRYPKSAISLLCRAAFVGLNDLLPVPADHVVPVSFDPQRFTAPGDDVRDALAALGSQLHRLECDLVISAELEPTWLSWYLASLWRAPVNLACTRLEPPRGLLPILLHERHLELVLFAGPTHHADLAESDRYRALSASAGAKEWVQRPWPLSADLALQGDELLTSLGLKSGEYGVCFPLGAGSTLVKRWPTQSFATALEAATEHFQLPILLTGESHERTALEEHASLIRERGGQASIFAGRADQLHLLAALLRGARFYLGNDTGPAHLAQAYQTPGVVIFGGGTWPHYRPWGPGTVGVVHPLHCFGCRWDCAFGRVLCIDAVSTEGVIEALRQSSASPSAPASVLTLSHASAELQQIVGDASQSYRASQQDRLSRFQALVETQYSSNSSQLQLVQISRELQQQRLLVADLQGRQSAATTLAPMTALIEMEGGLERIESRLAESVGVARSLLAAQRDERSHLSEATKAAEERMVIIDRLSLDTEQLRAEADKRLEALIEANSIMAAQQLEQNRLLNVYSEAKALIDWQRERLREFETAAASRLGAIEEANVLLRRKDEAAERQRVEFGSLQGSFEIQGRLLNELELAANSRLDALGQAATDIANSRKAAVDRLAAIEKANALLAHAQQVAEGLRQKSDRLTSELTLANQRLAVAEPAAAERLAALEDVNRLLAAEQANAETVRQETARLSSELTLATQRLAVAEPAAAERLAALEDVNRLLAAEQANVEAVRQEVARLSSELTLANQRLAVAEPAAAERLAALEDVNRLLAAEQANAEIVRQDAVRLASELTLATQRAVIAEHAAEERLTALQQVSGMLAAANQANQEQFERLLVFESAAVERLIALEATAGHLRNQTASNSAMRSDLAQVASEVARAQALQMAEREHWQLAMAELRNARANEHSARLIVEEQLAELQLRSIQVASERDQYLRATRELQISEQQLTNQVLAMQTDTLVQSVFRRLRQLF